MQYHFLADSSNPWITAVSIAPQVNLTNRRIILLIKQRNHDSLPHFGRTRLSIHVADPLYHRYAMRYYTRQPMPTACLMDESEAHTHPNSIQTTIQHTAVARQRFFHQSPRHPDIPPSTEPPRPGGQRQNHHVRSFRLLSHRQQIAGKACCITDRYYVQCEKRRPGNGFAGAIFSQLTDSRPFPPVLV